MPPFDSKEFRSKYGLSQRDLAALLDVTRRTVINWENRKTHPRIIVTNRITKLVIDFESPGQIAPIWHKEIDLEVLEAKAKILSKIFGQALIIQGPIRHRDSTTSSDVGLNPGYWIDLSLDPSITAADQVVSSFYSGLIHKGKRKRKSISRRSHENT